MTADMRPATNKLDNVEMIMMSIGLEGVVISVTITLIEKTQFPHIALLMAVNMIVTFNSTLSTSVPRFADEIRRDRKKICLSRFRVLFTTSTRPETSSKDGVNLVILEVASIKFLNKLSLISGSYTVKLSNKLTSRSGVSAAIISMLGGQPWINPEEVSRLSPEAASGLIP